MNQTGQIVFIIFIIAYMIFWGTIIYIGIPKEQRAKQKQQFDERQKVEQYRACQYAYFTLIIYLVLYLLLNQAFYFVWCDTVFGISLGIVFSLSVFLAYCVFQDAYFGIGASKPATLFTANIAGLPNLMLGIESIEDGNIIENGLITGKGIHFAIFALIVLLDIFVFIRKRLDKQAA